MEAKGGGRKQVDLILLGVAFGDQEKIARNLFDKAKMKRFRKLTY